MNINMMMPLTGNMPKPRKLWGFDIETKGNKNKFVMCSIVGDDNIKAVFWDKDDFIKFLKTKLKYFRHGFITATNLGFDILGALEDTDMFNKFFPVLRGSSMIYVKVYIDKYRKLRFIDTMSFLKWSVEQWGAFLKIPKLPKPNCFKRQPKGESERKELVRYNLNDSFITYRAIKFLQLGFTRIGAKLRITAPSTAIDLYRRRFLEKPVIQPEKDILMYMYKGYYGGRTEIIKRGFVKNLHYFDVNSLYPSVMVREYPDPASLIKTDKVSRQNIFDYEGLADVTVNAPKMYIPYLPYRFLDAAKQKKLIFPYGVMRGHYTFFELRRAVLLGYRIEKIHSAVMYTKTKKFFDKYVRELFNKRKEYKAENNPMEQLYKLMLNSLYGKFGQRIDNKQEIVHMDNVTMNMINNSINFFQTGNFMVFNKKIGNIPRFVNPIFSIYTTAYARDVLYNLMSKNFNSIYYYDTDSLMTSKNYEESLELGELKKEFSIKSGVLVKPKMYMVNDIIKCKGLSRMTKADFMNILMTKTAKVTRFVKFKEANRRGLKYNEIIDFSKLIDVEDSKRVWPEKFNKERLQDSEPIMVKT